MKPFTKTEVEIQIEQDQTGYCINTGPLYEALVESDEALHKSEYIDINLLEPKPIEGIDFNIP